MLSGVDCVLARTTAVLDELGCSFDLPPDFEQLESDEGFAWGSKQRFGRFRTVLVVQESTVYQGDFREFAERLTQELLDMETMSVESTRLVQIDARPAWLIDGVLPEHDRALRCLYAVIGDKKRTLLLLFVGPAQNWSDLSPVFESSLQSLKFEQ